MIQAFLKKTENAKIEDIKKTKKDIIITVLDNKVTVNDNNEEVHKKVPRKINITRKVNENAKVIKQERAQELLNELEQIYTKK